MKRFSDGPVGGGDPKRHMEDATLPLPARLIPSIIGKGGAGIKSLVRQSGADIQTGRGDATETGERAISLRGSPLSVLHATILILKKAEELLGTATIADFADLRERFNAISTHPVVVPSSKTRTIIGKGGANIRSHPTPTREYSLRTLSSLRNPHARATMTRYNTRCRCLCLARHTTCGTVARATALRCLLADVG